MPAPTRKRAVPVGGAPAAPPDDRSAFGRVMDDLKKLSVERLRELARKHLGKGHSRLRTKAELLAALKDSLREPLSRLLGAAESVVPRAKGKVRVVDFPPGRKGRVRPERTASETDASSKPPVAPERRGHPTPPRGTPSPASSRAPGTRDAPARAAPPRGAESPASPRAREAREQAARATPPREAESPASPRTREAREPAARPNSRPASQREPAARTTPPAREAVTREPAPRAEPPPAAPRPPVKREAPTRAAPARETTAPAPRRGPAAGDAVTPATPPRGESSPAARPPTRREVAAGTRAVDTGAGKPRPEASTAPSGVSTQRGPAPRPRPPLPASDRDSAAFAESPSSRAARSAPATNGAPAAPAAGTTPARSTTPAPAPEVPVEEGFFDVPPTPRRSPRPPSPAEPFEPGPFATPREVGTDAPVLLVRDPTTLFVFWDFRRELERGAALGLREPRLLLRLHRGPDLDRTLELPLASRSTYVTGLGSGQEYTAEVLLLGRDGWTRPVGSRSAPRRLPPGRVSPQMEVRMLRLPWSEPLSGAPAPTTPSSPRYEPLDSPRRVQLPTSPGTHGPAGGPDRSSGPRSGKN